MGQPASLAQGNPQSGNLAVRGDNNAEEDGIRATESDGELAAAALPR